MEGDVQRRGSGSVSGSKAERRNHDIGHIPWEESHSSPQTSLTTMGRLSLWFESGIAAQRAFALAGHGSGMRNSIATVLVQRSFILNIMIHRIVERFHD